MHRLNINNNNKLKVHNNKTSSNSNHYICDYCKKELSTRQSRWRHMKMCNKKTNIESRLELLEDKLSSNINLESIITIMNTNIESIQNINEIINTLYFNVALKNIISKFRILLLNNISTFKLFCQNKNKFDKQIRDQVTINLGIINKLSDYIDYVEYQGTKQYLFRKYVDMLKKIKFNKNFFNDTTETIEFIDSTDFIDDKPNNTIKHTEPKLYDNNYDDSSNDSSDDSSLCDSIYDI